MTNSVDSLRARVGAMAINVICITYFNILPLVLGGAAEKFSLENSQLGFAAGTFMAGLAFVNLLGVFWVRRLNWQYLIVGGASLACTAFALPLFHFAPNLWIAGNFFAGLTSGVCYGISIASLGDTRNPVRNFALAYVGQTLVSATLIFFLPRVEFFGNAFTAGQAICAALMICCCAMAILLPHSGRQRNQVSPVQPENNRLFNSGNLLYIALAILLLNTVAESAVWAFLERIAFANNIDTVFASSVIAASFFAAAAGSLAAAYAGERFGLILPAVAAVVLSMTSVLGLHLATSTAIYALSVMLFAAAWNLGAPYRMALATSADTRGKFSTQIPAMQTMGAAIGPATGGLLIFEQNFSGVFALAISLWFITLLLFALAKAPLNQLSEWRDSDDSPEGSGLLPDETYDKN